MSRLDRARRELSRIGGLRIAVAATITAGYLAALVADERFRRVEACLSTQLVRAAGQMDARCIGHSAVYRLGDRLVGHEVTVGCTAVLVLFPFVAVVVMLILVPRVALARTLGALALATVAVVAVNQLRMLVIWAGMRELGVERGFALTHILVGTTVSTIGVVLAGMLALRIVLSGDRLDAAAV